MAQSDRDGTAADGGARQDSASGIMPVDEPANRLWGGDVSAEDRRHGGLAGTADPGTSDPRKGIDAPVKDMARRDEEDDRSPLDLSGDPAYPGGD